MGTNTYSTVGNRLVERVSPESVSNPGIGSCGVLSVFWISNIMTHLDGNYALGGNTCYWVLPHHNEIGRGMGGAGGGDDTGKGGEAGLRKT